MKENQQHHYPGPIRTVLPLICEIDFSFFRDDPVLFLAMGFPPDVYFILQKENLDLEVIKAMNQLNIPNRVIWKPN